MKFDENTLTTAKTIAAGAAALLSITSAIKTIKKSEAPTVKTVEADPILTAQLDVVLGLESDRDKLRGLQAMKNGSFDAFIFSLDQ